MKLTKLSEDFGMLLQQISVPLQRVAIQVAIQAKPQLCNYYVT